MSRLAQEIPQEIIQKAWEAGANRQYEFGDVSSLTFDAMTRALAAVLPDLQRPLREEMRGLQEGWDATDRALEEAQAERDRALEEIERLRAEISVEDVRVALHRWRTRAEKAEAERDARPDLTAEESRALAVTVGDWLVRYPANPNTQVWLETRNKLLASARAKMERSLDAHKP